MKKFQTFSVLNGSMTKKEYQAENKTEFLIQLKNEQLAKNKLSGDNINKK